MRGGIISVNVVHHILNYQLLMLEFCLVFIKLLSHQNQTFFSSPPHQPDRQTPRHTSPSGAPKFFFGTPEKGLITAESMGQTTPRGFCFVVIVALPQQRLLLGDRLFFQ